MNRITSVVGCCVVLYLVLCAHAISAAEALTLPGLQRLLQAGATARTVAFHELRESPWLAAPVESTGTMHISPQGLEKRVQTPRQETWRLLADRMEWIGSDGAGSKQILYGSAPAVAALAEALRRIVAGDLLALQRDFHIELRGGERHWTALLRPRSDEVGDSLDHLELEGTGGRLKVIILVERHGERTTTRLDY